MCKIYNTIGSLATVKSQLQLNNIHDFKSLKDVIAFQNAYTSIRQQLISHHKTLIEEEKNMLNADLQLLGIEIETLREQSAQRLIHEIDSLKQQLHTLASYTPTNFFRRIINYLKDWNYKRKIKHREQSFDNDINEAIANLVDDYELKSKRYQFIASNHEEALKQSAQSSLSDLDKKKATINELNNFIYGALGEQKVVKTLEVLSDEYFLINDFAVSFSPAIYHRQENDHIKSVQIDHILIGPSGLFLIETKNWSEKSLENLSLRSPVHQIKRTSFALFKLLNNEFSNYQLRLDNHHWGDKKISIRNLIVLTMTKPKEEFKFVKVLTVNELIGYVTYFKPTFSVNETQRIANFLLEINEQKTINV